MNVRIIKTPTLQKVKIKSLPKEQQGGNPEANAELESGEIFQDNTGEINKVPDSEPTHDEGGSPQANVSRVLEDTADKRKDIDSKLLKMVPDEVEAATGFRPKTPLTHSKAFEKSSDYWNKKLNNVENKIKASYDDATQSNSIFAKNSLKHNTQILKTIPTQQDLFNNLFAHQEQTKKAFNINDSGNNQNGGTPSRYATTFPDDINNPNLTMEDIRRMGTRYNNAFPNYNPIYSDNPNIQVEPQQTYHTYIPARFSTKFSPIPEIINDNSTTDNGSGYDTGTTYGFQQQGINTQTTNSNRFNEPLRWYDLAGPLAKLADNDRIGTKYNSVNLYEPKVRQLDVRPELESNQASFNSLKNVLANSTSGAANLGNLAAQKYRVDDTLIGQYENLNKGKLDQGDQISADIRNKQQLIDQQARATQELQQLKGIDAVRANKLGAINDIATRFAQNAKLNREGNLLMHMVNYFDQNGNYNGKKYNFNLPSNIPQTQGQQTSNIVNIGNNPYTGQPEYRYKINLPSGKSIYVKPATKQLPQGYNILGRQ
jgi:hypothetical protein